MHRLRPVSPELLQKARYADRPGRRPRGYFDAVAEPTKALLENGWNLGQAADWLMNHRAIKPTDREHYRDAMQKRFKRLQGRKASKGAQVVWRQSLGYERAHLVEEGKVMALCGATAARWYAADSDCRKCKQCAGREQVGK